MFKNPEQVLDQFVIGEGRTVADLGAGNGAYALSLARRVGGNGKVYAIDIQKDLLERLKNQAGRARIHNIDIVWGDIEKVGGTRLKDETVDAVLVVNVLFQAEDKVGLAHEAHRILKKGGRALLVDWKEQHSGLGPSQTHIVSSDEGRKIFENVGFVHERDLSAGDYHYGIVFRKT